MTGAPEQGMNSKAHTPGPWDYARATLPEFPALVHTDHGGNSHDCIATMDLGDDLQQDANACLIAAAPELLAELRASPCPGGGYTGQPADEYPSVAACLKAGVCGCNAGAAIAKAEGRAAVPSEDRTEGK